MDFGFRCEGKNFNQDTTVLQDTLAICFTNRQCKHVYKIRITL